MVITVMPLEDVDDESYATAADEQPEADDLKGIRAMNLAIAINGEWLMVLMFLLIDYNIYMPILNVANTARCNYY